MQIVMLMGGQERGRSFMQALSCKEGVSHFSVQTRRHLMHTSQTTTTT